MQKAIKCLSTFYPTISYTYLMFYRYKKPILHWMMLACIIESSIWFNIQICREFQTLLSGILYFCWLLSCVDKLIK